MNKNARSRVLSLVRTLIMVLVVACILFQSPLVKFKQASASNGSLLYQLDFSDEENIGKNTAGTEFVDATVPVANSLTIEDSKVGKALNFPGYTRDVNYLSLPTEMFENQDAITLSGWFFLPNGVDAYLGEFGIYSEDNDKSFRSDPYAMHFGNAYILCAGSTGSINLGTGVKPVYDAWYHMAYVIDAENGTFTVFQNGSQVLQTPLEDGFSPAQYYSANSHFYLGQSSYERDHDDYRGKMSDIRVYGSALTANELREEYSLFITDFITAEYTFDTEETLFVDNIRGYDLATYKQAPSFEDGTMRLAGGSAVQAYNKGNNQNVKFFDGHANLTISMDLNIKTGVGDHWKRVMDMFIDGGYRMTYMAYCPRYEGNNFFEITYARDGDHNMLSDDSFTLPNQTWFNLTIVFEGNEVRVYENEVLKVTANTLAERPTFSQFFFDLANSEQGNFTIGSNTYEDNNWITADYDNIRIYAAAAKTTEELQSVRVGFEYRYKITYHANNGSDASRVQYVDTTDTAQALENPFTKEGSLFTGWNTAADGSGVSYGVEDLISLTEDLELFAQWEFNSHFISFNANGGRGEMTDQIVEKETSANLKANEFLRTGYLFSGWNTAADGSGDAYEDEESITPAGNVVLYAQWQPKTYKVTFNSNNGTGEMVDQELTFGVSSTLSKNLFSRHGYVFSGWAYTSEGTKVFDDEEAIESILEGDDVLLYAVWSIGEFTVTYNANGGTGSMDSSTAEAFTFINLAPNTYTRSGYVFSGWAESAEGEVVYEDNERIDLDDSLTLYAVWTLGTFTITYNANGGTGTMVSSSGNASDQFTLEANAYTRAGYVFSGWAESADGEVVYEDEEEVTLDGDLTLYAVWSLVTVTVTYNANGGTGTMENSVGDTLSSLALRVNTFEKEGYKFKGWAESADGEVVYEDEEEVTLDGDLTLYAVWEVLPSEDKETNYTGWIVTASVSVAVAVSAAVFFVIRRRKRI